MRKTVAISEVEPDISPNESIGLYNPLADDFTCLYGGKEFTIKAGEQKIWPKPVAMHVGKHLADKIVRGNLNAFLQAKFPGLTEEGRVKWRMQVQVASTKDDVLKVRDGLLVQLDDFGKEVEAPVVPAPVVEKEPDIIAPANLSEQPSAEAISEQIKARKNKEQKKGKSKADLE